MKLRALSDTRIYRDENQVREYGRRLKEIEKIMGDIDAKIKRLEEEIKG